MSVICFYTSRTKLNDEVGQDPSFNMITYMKLINQNRPAHVTNTCNHMFWLHLV